LQLNANNILFIVQLSSFLLRGATRLYLSSPNETGGDLFLLNVITSFSII